MNNRAGANLTKPTHGEQILIREILRCPAGPADFSSNPLAKGLGLRLISADPAEGRVELAFEPTATFVDSQGVLQRWAVLAMLDLATLFATLAQLPARRYCATVSLSSSFMRRPAARSFIAVGKVARSGTSVAFARGTVMEADQTLVATAEATFSLTTAD